MQARYIMSGPNLNQGNTTVRQILVSAMNNTLQMGGGVPITLQSFTSFASRKASHFSLLARPQFMKPLAPCK